MNTNFVALVLALGLSFTKSAHAYLDPGTGSMILQAIVAGFFGSLFVIKTYWARIVGFIRKGNPAQTDLASRKDRD